MAGAGSNSPLIMLELRHLGGALARLPADLSPMGRRDSKFLMFGAGATPTPEVAQAVQANLVRLAEEMRPYETGATYVNFLEFGGQLQNEYARPMPLKTGSAWWSSRIATTHKISSASTATSRLLGEGVRG